VDSDGDSRWAAYLSVADEAVLDSLVGEFCNELTDQQLRVVLEKEFGELRTLIVAQAFSEGNLLDPDRETADDKADPRGTRIRR
jgi:hypothetical protein